MPKRPSSNFDPQLRDSLFDFLRRLDVSQQAINQMKKNGVTDADLKKVLGLIELLGNEDPAIRQRIIDIHEQLKLDRQPNYGLQKRS